MQDHLKQHLLNNNLLEIIVVGGASQGTLFYSKIIRFLHELFPLQRAKLVLGLATVMEEQRI